jgi:hypothetical protein
MGEFQKNREILLMLSICNSLEFLEIEGGFAGELEVLVRLV